MDGRFVRTPGLLVVLLALSVHATAQQGAAPSITPQQSAILLSPQEHTSVRSGTATHPVLAQVVRLDLNRVPLAQAFDEVARRAGVDIGYSQDILPRNGSVSLRSEAITVRDALDRILRGTELDVVVSSSGNLSVVRRPAPKPEPREEAQQGTVVGQVTDAATGAALRLANVRLEGTRMGAVTGVDGRYRIENVPAGTHTLVASMIGYSEARAEVSAGVGEIATANFVLSVSPMRLDGVVVTATGEQRRRELGHVLGSIRGDSVVRAAPVTRLSDLVGARVAGVQIISNTGLSGESPRIRIRGLGTVSRSRDPLLYVDGIRVEGSSGSGSLPIAGPVQGVYGILPGRLNDLNPEEIESIEVVRGPSAATLYGTDAANGVILVRTKRGEPGRARWNMYLTAGQLRPAPSFDNANTYYSWGTNSATGATQRCILTQIATGACVQDSLTVFNPIVHAATTPIGAGARTQFGIQVRGGAPHITYFMSADHEQETGYLRMPAQEIERLRDERGGAGLPGWQIRPNFLERQRLRGSVDVSINQDTDVRISSGLIFGQTAIPSSNIWPGAYWGPGYRDGNDGWWAGNRPGEVLATKSTEELARYTGSIAATWRPLPWLRTRATAGTDLSTTFFDGLQRPGEGPTAGRNGRRLNSRNTVALYTGDLGASVVTEASSWLSSRTSIGVQYNRRLQLATFASATDLPPGSETVTGAANVTGGEGREESVVAGLYLEHMFGLNDRLFLTAALRADGGSSFGRNFRAAVYPKAGASWVISEEDFFHYIRGIENLRLRLAYGHSGVQPGSTDALEFISRFTSTADGAATTGAALTRLGNSTLKPERQREFEGGIDAILLGGRLTLEATYYNKLSTDALLQVPLAPSIGVGSRWENLGSVRNWGYEGLVEVLLLQQQSLTWEATLNASFNRNRLEELGVGSSSIGAVLDAQHREGFPLFGRWGRPILSYSDSNGNGIIEPNEVTVGDTVAFLGAAHPPRQLTATTALTLFDGRFRLASQFDYRGGHVVPNNSTGTRCSFFFSCAAVNDRNTSLFEQARAVAAIHHGTNAGYREDASFIRWRELAATWQFPTVLSRRLGLSDLSLALSVRNLHLWTTYTGVDPEVNVSPGSQIIEGPHDNPIAPQTRYLLLRMDAGF